jgi:hypothetical protein
VLPFVVEEIILASLTDDITESVRRIVDGCVRSFVFLVNHALPIFKLR